MKDLLQQWLDDEITGWSMGSFGAISEFIRWPGDAPARATDHGMGWYTPRGGIRIDRPDGVTALAWDMPSTKSERFFRHVEFLLPEAEALMPQPEGFTELGPDTGAIRPEDRDMILFDCGLQQKNVRFCVRTRDAELIAEMRRCEGMGNFAPGNTAAAMIFARHPHRISITAIGRVEVYQKIGGPDTDWKSPDGPHTHLLPKLLAAGRTHSANTPIPPGFLPVASLHPASPFSLPDGTKRPFCRQTWAHYCDLMEAHRSTEARELRAALARGATLPAGEIIDADEITDDTPLPQSRHLRHTARVWELERKMTQV
ncbi:DUF6925 family protein [Falsigemmobacter faecalis]|uniref:Uncharacterized protein n=1 Tax=Falsigemmobacter faecalis TaxID=2488730 RepID=A0A3P3DEX6_9RHOB|nr:hypothetical protein [Falsigemmobacter faecalis]RRH72052.1 hypothetical protein EG244_15605 [Falsigemmobacter faecalis]